MRDGGVPRVQLMGSAHTDMAGVTVGTTKPLAWKCGISGWGPWPHNGASGERGGWSPSSQATERMGLQSTLAPKYRI